MFACSGFFIKYIDLAQASAKYANVANVIMKISSLLASSIRSTICLSHYIQN